MTFAQKPPMKNEVLCCLEGSSAESRGELHPDPRFRVINAVSLAVEDDADNTTEIMCFIRGNNDSSHRRRLCEITQILELFVVLLFRFFLFWH
jgi:hypothetical protein